MRKAISILLTLALLLVMLAGCAKAQSGDAADRSDDPGAVPAESDSPDSGEEPTASEEDVYWGMLTMRNLSEEDMYSADSHGGHCHRRHHDQ